MAVALWKMLEGQIVEGRYRLQSLLGTGAFGGVYRANEIIGGRILRQVAIKLISPHRDIAPDRQFRELELAVSIDHPAIVRCFSAGECDIAGQKLLYLVMELAEESLDVRLNRRRLPALEAGSLLASLADALAYLHAPERRLVHRDIKPQNLLFCDGRWKLGDFGVARSVSSSSISHSMPAGTTCFMPPEGFDGEISLEWDIWSYGVLAVYLASGSMPFSGSTGELIRTIREEQPRIPAQMPSQWKDLALLCLQKDRRQRPNARALLQMLDATGGSKPPTPPPRELVRLGTGIRTETYADETQSVERSRDRRTIDWAPETINADPVAVRLSRWWTHSRRIMPASLLMFVVILAVVFIWMHGVSHRREVPLARCNVVFAYRSGSPYQTRDTGKLPLRAGILIRADSEKTEYKSATGRRAFYSTKPGLTFYWRLSSMDTWHRVDLTVNGRGTWVIPTVRKEMPAVSPATARATDNVCVLAFVYGSGEPCQVSDINNLQTRSGVQIRVLDRLGKWIERLPPGNGVESISLFGPVETFYWKLSARDSWHRVVLNVKDHDIWVIPTGGSGRIGKQAPPVSPLKAARITYRVAFAVTPSRSPYHVDSTTDLKTRTGVLINVSSNAGEHRHYTTTKGVVTFFTTNPSPVHFYWRLSTSEMWNYVRITVNDGDIWVIPVGEGN